MCVLAFYAKGIDFDYAELHNCFQFNPDGAGVMWQTKEGVHIKKGFMKEEELIKFLATVPNNVDRLIHFRIATSGKVSVGCCHPFPVCNDFKKMMKEEQIVPLAYAHNGVLHEYTPKDGLKSAFSDTMVFGKDILSHLVGMGIDLFDPVVDTLLENTIGTDKMVIISKDESVLLGKFELAPSGAKYSNCSYERNRFEKRVTTGKYFNDWINSCYTNAEPYRSVTFDASISFDTSRKVFTGWTKDDFTDFVEENLMNNGITCISFDYAVHGNVLIITIGCWADNKTLKGAFKKVLSYSKLIKDTWTEQCNCVDVHIKAKISNLLIEESYEDSLF